MPSSKGINMETTHHVILFYNYVSPGFSTEDVAFACEEQNRQCTSLSLTGRILLGREGINGTLSSPSRETLFQYCSWMQNHSRFSLNEDDFKWSIANVSPFPDFTVKRVREIVSTNGIIAAPKSGEGGVHLSPEKFHDMLLEEKTSAGKETVLVDVRNNKEFMVGHFKGALDPGLVQNSQLPSYLEENAEKWKDKRVMMYCTGGIRCEKASKYLKELGVPDVYQLQGGIHKYLEKFPDGGQWLGKNFVFDRRLYQTSANMPPERLTIGKCYHCEKLFDEVDGSSICTLCLKWVLVCHSCRPVLHFQYHCSTHRHLQSCYFTRLDGFSGLELTNQLNQLVNLYSELAGEKGSDTTRKNRNKRKTLNKQIARIRNELTKRRNEGVSDSEAVGTHLNWCRTCRKTSCDGNCWGFWAASKNTDDIVDSKGYQKSMESGMEKAEKAAIADRMAEMKL